MNIVRLVTGVGKELCLRTSLERGRPARRTQSLAAILGIAGETPALQVVLNPPKSAGARKLDTRTKVVDVSES